MLLTVSNDDSYTAALNESLEAVLERAFAGSRVVVATSSLTGVHYATLLARVATAVERELPITFVGQAAKLYNALEYDEPSVTPVVYEDGRWNAPGWIAEATARRIRRRHWEAVQEQSLEADGTLEINRREPITLEGEGVNLGALEETVARTAADPYASTDSDGVAADTETLPPETGSLEAQSLEAEFLGRLEAIDAKLECSEDTVRARVLSGGEGDHFLHLLDPAELEPGESIEITLKTDSRSE